jgi:uncharacterized protein YutE (UPF0331/DUF86 family)
MTAIDQQTVASRLAMLNEVIAKLSKINTLPKKDFFDDFFISDTAIRNLVLGIEIILDIGNHILSAQYQVSAKTYKDVIMELGRLNVISEGFAAQQATMADFRNLLIHAYSKISLERVYDYMGHAPDIFKTFAAVYLAVIEQNQE